MNARRKRDFLKTQLIESKELLAGVADHPLMASAFQERVEELEEEIAELPAGQKEPRTVLFFSGEPVQGSMGIDANFAARVLGPFQNIVATEHAHRWHGVVGSRGRRVGEEESRLLLTGLPRGSFGFELTKGWPRGSWDRNAQTAQDGRSVRSIGQVSQTEEVAKGYRSPTQPTTKSRWNSPYRETLEGKRYRFKVPPLKPTCWTCSAASLPTTDASKPLI